VVTLGKLVKVWHRTENYNVVVCGKRKEGERKGIVCVRLVVCG